MADQKQPRNAQIEEHYMRQALDVARAALEVGEVPVGCVALVLSAEPGRGRRGDPS